MGDRGVDTAFVLGGGGLLGASEVGMLRALVELGIKADVVLGTSVGAINGAVFAADPTLAAVAELTEVWGDLAGSGLYSGSTLGRVRHFARTRTHAHSNEALRRMLHARHGDVRIEQLAVTFQCVAASIERAAEHWFTEGPLVEAVLASSAVPGVFPPVEIGGEHFLDGGLVNSIPVGRALALGARRVYVLQVGRVERPLEPPSSPFEVGMVAFEIARRHRFAADLASVPDGVQVHVLPTGAPDPPRYGDLSALRYRDHSRTADRIEQAYRASLDHLERTAR